MVFRAVNTELVPALQSKEVLIFVRLVAALASITFARFGEHPFNVVGSNHHNLSFFLAKVGFRPVREFRELVVWVHLLELPICNHLFTRRVLI